LILLLVLTSKLPAQTVIFSDGFENGLNGWLAADNNLDLPGLPCYWGVVDSAFGGEGVHGGSNKVYCAAVGYSGTTLSPLYQPNMAATLSRTIDLTGYTNATLSFWHRLPSIEGPPSGFHYDFAVALMDNQVIWSNEVPVTVWTQVSVSLDAFVGGPHNLQFLFISDRSLVAEGWYLDDIQVTDAVTPFRPANDNFSAATLLSGAVGTVTALNGSATAQPGEPADGFSATNSVWFKWTAVTNGMVTFRTGGSSFDTILCVYTGSALAALSQVGCDDNGDTNGASLISFEAVKDTAYSISVRGNNNARGVVQLHWIQSAGLGVDLLPDLGLWVSESLGYLHGWYLDRYEPTQPGRTLLRASTATMNIGAGNLELIGSSLSPGVYQRIYSSDGGHRDVYAGTFTFHPGHGHLHFDNWLSFFLREVLPGEGVGGVVAAGNKTSFAIIDLQGYDLTLPGARQQPFYMGGLVQGLSVGWADVYGASLPDQWIDVTEVPPGRYWLEAVVDPENHIIESNESNNVARILIETFPVDVVPPNDNFASPTVLAGVSASVVSSSKNASKENGEPRHWPGDDGGASVWYRWTAPSNMSVALSTEGSSFDTVLAVYTGSYLGGLTVVSQNNNADTTRAFSRVTFNASINFTYRIAIDGFEGAEGSVELSVNPAWNDDFSRPIQLSGVAGSVSASTRGATRQAGEPQHAGVAGSNSIWYVWTAPTNGPFTFDTSGSGFDTLLAVYTGMAFPLTLVAENDNLGPTNTASRVTFDATSNTIYRIAVDGLPGPLGEGALKLSWNGPTRPAIVSQPVGTNLVAGASVQFSVGAIGPPPLHYQWRHFGTNALDDERIFGATSPILSIGKIYTTDSGAYSVVITNAWGAVTSTPANLIVLDNPRVIYAEHHSAAVGGVAKVPVQMQAVGDERALQFSLAYDPGLLSNPRATTGANTAGATLAVDSSQAGSGELGISLALPPSLSLPTGSHLEIAIVSFDVSGTASVGEDSVVGFGNQPIPREVLSASGLPLVTLFVAGSVTLEDWTATASGQVTGDGRFQLSLIGPPSHTYIIEATTDLATQSWVPMSTNQTSIGGLLQFLDTDTTSHRYRFFRARMVP
jgi:hypothetical protein